MVALTADRDTKRRDITTHHDPVKAGAVIYAGALVALDANGWLVPGATATTLKARGRAEERVDNTGGADGAVIARVATGVFRFANLGADPVARADIGNDCFIVDDQTVAKTNGTNTRSKAGRVVELDSAGVWVEIR